MPTLQHGEGAEPLHLVWPLKVSFQATSSKSVARILVRAASRPFSDVLAATDPRPSVPSLTKRRNSEIGRERLLLERMPPYPVRNYDVNERGIFERSSKRSLLAASWSKDSGGARRSCAIVDSREARNILQGSQPSKCCSSFSQTESSSCSSR
jgi:hypothetical protein